MRKLVTAVLALAFALPVAAQQQSLEGELRAEIARLKESVARAEALLARVEKAPPAAAPLAASAPAPSPAVAEAKPTAPAPPPKAPALNTPPKLPPTGPESFRKTPPRIDVLLQSRYDYYDDPTRNSTFFLRKAEIGLKGNIAKNVDFSVEVDLVRTQANDPYRRTYIRLSHFKHLHFKVGLEKAPIGLDELTSNGQITFVERTEVSDRFSAAEELGLFAESNWDRLMLQASFTNGGRRLHRDDNRKKAFSARAVWAATRKFTLGAATMQGETGANLADRIRYNAEAKYGSNNLQGAQGEFYRAKDGTIWSTAFYVQGYWAKPVKKSWLTHVMPVARYEQIDQDNDDPARELRLITVGVGLLLNEHKSKLQFNWLKDVRSNSPRKDELRAQYTVEF